MVNDSLMGDSPDAGDNRLLHPAMEDGVPVICFLGISPAVYQPIFPAYVVSWNTALRNVQVAFGEAQRDDVGPPATTDARRYTLRQVQQRLHQASFRQAVITADNGRCALSRLPEPILLDAAHIMPDHHDTLGQPIVPNGLPLTKIHHAAYDAHLIGIGEKYRLHVSQRLREQKDGPILEAIQRLHGQVMYLPERSQDRPDPRRLADRFQLYQQAN